MPAPSSKPPVAARKPVTSTLHGIARSDDYAWLKDPDWQRVMREPDALDAQIRAYLEAENAHTDAFLAPHEALREALYAEMRGRMKEDESSVPAPDGDWAYYVRYVEGGEHPVYCRAPRRDETTEVLLLDGNREAEGEAYFRVGDCEHSPDHRRLAYTLDLNGSERYRLFVRDIASGKVIDGPIEDAHGEAIWAADGETVFYTVLDENHRPWQVRRHRIGAAGTDPVVYEESDPGSFLRLGESESRRFVLISAHDHTTSEVRLIEAAAPESAPRLVAARERGIEYDIACRGERLYILTNAGGATDFKIMTAPLDAPAREGWQDWLPHEPGTYVRTQLLFAGHHVRLERVGGLPRIVVTDLESGEVHTIAFDEEAYDLSLLPGYEFETETLRFVYSSMTTPRQTYDYDMRARARTLRKTQEVPSGHDPADYVTRRLWAVSHDGARVPVSLLHRRTTPARRLCAAPPLRLRLVRPRDPGRVLHQPAQPGRSRLRLRHRPHPGRQRLRLRLVSRRQAREEDQYLRRLHRRRRAPDRRTLHGAGADRGPRRQRGRHADGGGRQHAARPLRQHRGRGALRRRA